MAVSVPRSMALDTVRSGSRIFSFQQPIDVEVSCDEGVWQLVHPATGLNSYGESIEQALERFGEDLAYVWDEYVGRADADLGGRALAAKGKVLELVASVSEA